MSSPAPEPSPGLTALRSWCGWHIAPSRTETIEVESDGSNALLLPSLHVTDVLSVLDEDENPVTGWRRRRAGFLRGDWNADEVYTVEMVHGHESLPGELAEIVDQLDEGGVGRVIESKKAGPFSHTYATSADLETQPISVRSIVSRYRIPGAV